MKKAAAIILIFVICISFGACVKYSPGITVSSQASAAETPNLTAASSKLSFAHATDVFSDPDKYKGVTYESPFKITGGEQQLEGKSVYLAAGYIMSNSIKAYAVFDFDDTPIPELSAGDIVYAKGVIEGKGFVSDGEGNSVDVLWLGVNDIERYVDKAGIKSPDKDYTFKDGEYKASSGALSIEVIGLKFAQDSLTLMTKTGDTSAKSKATYYVDIVAHQNGYFSLYSGCDFWIAPNGTAGYDSIPLPAMDSSKDISIDFVPFSEDGKLLYEPLTIDFKLG